MLMAIISTGRYSAIIIADYILFGLPTIYDAYNSADSGFLHNLAHRLYPV